MMDDQTQSMSALIDFFKLSHDEASAPAAPRKETPSRTTAHSSQQKAVRRAPVKRTAPAASHSAVDTMDDEF
jgi:hypothetical protein